MKKVFCIRHAPTRGNIEKRYTGTTDEGLAEEGLERLRCEKERYPEVDMVFSSPLKRCFQTAQTLYGAEKIRILSALRECDFGVFENKTYEELRHDASYRAWIGSHGRGDIPGGERAEDFKRRCCTAFERVLESMGAEDAGRAAIVAHGGTFMTILEVYMPAPVPNDECYYQWQMKTGDVLELTVKDLSIAEVRKVE